MFGMSNFLKLPRDSWPVFLFFSNDEVFLLNGTYPLTCVPRRLCCWTTCGRGNRPIQLRNDWLLVCHLWHAAWSGHVIGFVWVREGAYSGFVHATEHYCSLCAFLMNLHLPSRTSQNFYLSILLLFKEYKSPLFYHPCLLWLIIPFDWQVPRYSSVVPRPMWLEKVRENLDGRYRLVGEFISDVRLIFKNCAIYNRVSMWG